MIDLEPVRLEERLTPKEYLDNRDRVMAFATISLDEIEIFRELFAAAQMPICDYTIGGTFLWVDYSDYQFAIERNTLFISELLPSGERGYWTPIGQMSLEQSICRLLEHTSALGEELKLYPVQSHIVDRLRENFTVGDVERFEGRGDYVHSIDEFAHFAGRRYSKKRNHLKRFLRENSDHHFREFTHDQLEALITFHTSLSEESVESEDINVVNLRAYENRAVASALQCHQLYNYESLLLYSGDSICGFCFGEVVGDTLFVHAEKCLKSMVGCHQHLASQYAQRMKDRYPNLRWINREDDMNIPNIRRAKESYHPDKIIEKYIVHIDSL